MTQRGRKSAAELAVVGSGLSVNDRPQPPRELTDEQSQEWLAVVNRMPADWFQRETHPLLTQYCRHVVSARRVAQLIEQLCESETFSPDDYEKLLKMQEREGRALSSLATRMRITQQSSYDKERKRGSSKPKPWEL